MSLLHCIEGFEGAFLKICKGLSTNNFPPGDVDWLLRTLFLCLMDLVSLLSKPPPTHPAPFLNTPQTSYIKMVIEYQPKSNKTYMFLLYCNNCISSFEGTF